MLERQLEQIIRQQEAAMIQTCSRLLQTPSVNGQDDEVAVVHVLAEIAASLGLHTHIAGENPQRPNLIISTASEGETGLLLIGHTDTVPPGDPSQWKHPPFSGAVDTEEGRIYGRGAVDTKGGMTAGLYALAALRDLPNALPNGRAQMVCVPDEESGATGTLGIKYLHKQKLLHGKGAIYVYSGRELNLGHRGLIRLKLICHGEATHTGGDGWQDGTVGANAVTGMARLLLALEAIDLPYASLDYFDQFKTIITPGTMISGGVSINIVPDTCEALVDIRTTPEYDWGRIKYMLDGEIKTITDRIPRLRFDYERLNYLPAAISDLDAPLFALLQDVTEDLTGQRPERCVAGPANEGYLLIERGIPTVCGFGPLGAGFHAVDEYVEIDSLMEAAAIYALTAHRLDAMR